MSATRKLGDHYICDLSGCNHELLMDGDRCFAVFSQAVRASGLTVVDQGLYKFSPHGFTCFLLLAESHACLHAWPEYDYCAVDIFTCTVGKDLLPLIDELKRALGANDLTIRMLDRNTAIHDAVAIRDVS